MVKVEITQIALETAFALEQYMAEFIEAPEYLTEQLIDLANNKLSKDPLSCPICPELEELGVYDYRQMTVDENYKILYRFDEVARIVFITAFMRTKQNAEKLLVKMALLN
ncbi:hypothetical protein A3715_15845 [Oleiphilus sp. HI0009]|nr:hypothetical protein A3715_15845 [Oleiphilus sp. HI0009]